MLLLQGSIKIRGVKGEVFTALRNEVTWLLAGNRFPEGTGFFFHHTWHCARRREVLGSIPGGVLGKYTCDLVLLSAFSSPGVQSACNRSIKEFLGRQVRPARKPDSSAAPLGRTSKGWKFNIPSLLWVFIIITGKLHILAVNLGTLSS